MSSKEELADWLRLCAAPGVGSQSQRALLKAFGSPAAIFANPSSELARVVTRAQAQALAQVLVSHDAQAEIDAALAWCEKPGNHLFHLGDANYPQALLDIPDPPTLLYVMGDPALLNKTACAVVGARAPTAQGEDNAQGFAKALSNAGLVIVSGLAQGIDAAAHRGGLQGRGRSIAVIGTGADRVYPAKNQALARRLADEGAIISEFPLGTPPVKENFPRRNRLISGLSAGCLVVEAGLPSGSLITARLAAEQGRDVFAIPGSIHSPLSKGCHWLIKQGAKLVDDANDILSEMRLVPQASKAVEAASLPEAQQKLLNALGYDPCEMDTLVARTGLTVEPLYAMLLAMELEGLISCLPGGRYQRR